MGSVQKHGSLFCPFGILRLSSSIRNLSQSIGYVGAIYFKHLGFETRSIFLLKQSVEYAADAAGKTGQEIRQTVSAGIQSTGEFTNSAMDAVKDTSQAGLEKIGLATPVKSTLEEWEDDFHAAKEKATPQRPGYRYLEFGPLEVKCPREV
ncbi:hypothetical protein R1flu_007030 [Riccia fluitans]|uniref:Uncharacterized protein n=1 Tax=Riccia fluitans TaxID=41844 RepID=A0ABD1YXP4_9MARC